MIPSVTVQDKIPFKSEIQITAFEDIPDHLDSLDALKAELIRQFPEYADSPKHEVMAAIRAGKIKGVNPVRQSRGENMILRGFYEDLFARFTGSPGANQTLEIKYLSLGLSYAQSSFSQSSLTSEYYRDTPDETYDDGSRTFYATLYIKKSEANPTANTTLTAGASNTVTVTSATGFVNGGRIQIETDNATYNATITGIAGSAFTVGAITGNGLIEASAFPDDDIPASTNTCKALISEGGCIISDDATTTLDTGKPLNRKRLEEEKDTSVSLLFDYILAGTSVES